MHNCRNEPKSQQPAFNNRWSFMLNIWGLRKSIQPLFCIWLLARDQLLWKVTLSSHRQVEPFWLVKPEFLWRQRLCLADAGLLCCAWALLTINYGLAQDHLDSTSLKQLSTDKFQLSAMLPECDFLDLHRMEMTIVASWVRFAGHCQVQFSSYTNLRLLFDHWLLVFQNYISRSKIR